MNKVLCTAWLDFCRQKLVFARHDALAGLNQKELELVQWYLVSCDNRISSIPYKITL